MSNAVSSDNPSATPTLSPTLPSAHAATPRTLMLARMLCITAMGITGLITRAGPLDPPAGPVAPTYKTLSDVEPRIAINASNTPGDATAVFRITATGSYYLTGNVTGASGKSGIVIAADNVSIDLNGFTLQGVPGAASGITSNAAHNGINIRDGTIASWPVGGINLPFVSSSTTTLYRIEGVRARGNTGAGINIGQASLLIGCEVANNTGRGIDVANHAVLNNCMATSNGGDGFELGFGSTVENCAARGNAGHGFFTVSGGDLTLLSCSASTNQLSGFVVNRASLQNCSASFNTVNGYEITNSTIQGCTGFNNAGGILAQGGCTVISNTIAAGNFGIRVTDIDNRIESNNTSSSTTGYDITSAGNLIIRNAASGGTTRYNIVGGNASGPIINAAATSSTVIHTANFDY